jgi:hypothetical protein
MSKPFYECSVCMQGFEVIEELHRHEREYHNFQPRAWGTRASTRVAAPAPGNGAAGPVRAGQPSKK